MHYAYYVHRDVNDDDDADDDDNIDGNDDDDSIHFDRFVYVLVSLMQATVQSNPILFEMRINACMCSEAWSAHTQNDSCSSCHVQLLFIFKCKRTFVQKVNRRTAAEESKWYAMMRVDEPAAVERYNTNASIFGY